MAVKPTNPPKQPKEKKPSVTATEAEPVDLASVPVRLGPQRKKLTPEIIAQYCRALNLPATHEQASAVVGFSARTIRAWLAAGEEEDCEDPLLIEFAAKVAQVNVGGKRAHYLRLVEEHAAVDPKAAMRLLEVFSPSTRVEKTMKVDMTVEPKKPAQLDYSKLTDEQFAIVQRADEIKLLLTEGQ